MVVVVDVFFSGGLVGESAVCVLGFGVVTGEGAFLRCPLPPRPFRWCSRLSLCV